LYVRGAAPMDALSEFSWICALLNHLLVVASATPQAVRHVIADLADMKRYLGRRVRQRLIQNRLIQSCAKIMTAIAVRVLCQEL
jgi:hypothetical protein